jgi:hypothetical protein
MPYFTLFIRRANRTAVGTFVEPHELFEMSPSHCVIGCGDVVRHDLAAY